MRPGAAALRRWGVAASWVIAGMRRARTAHRFHAARESGRRRCRVRRARGCPAADHGRPQRGGRCRAARAAARRSGRPDRALQLASHCSAAPAHVPDALLAAVISFRARRELDASCVRAVALAAVAALAVGVLVAATTPLLVAAGLAGLAILGLVWWRPWSGVFLFV